MAAPVATWSLGGRGRRLLLAFVAAPLLVACGALPGEEPEPQFPPPPQEEPIGVPGTPARDQAAAMNVTGVPYSQAYPEDPGGLAVASPGDGNAPDEYADTDPSALTDFRAALDPYGQWFEDPTYGTIWQPSAGVVGGDFAPYETDGHWAYGGDYVWVSDYAWGWVPFHYGRWVYATNGWGWIPGRQYAGAWTTWRTGYGAYGNYVGWAPLPPTYYWNHGVAVGVGAVPPAPYAFCHSGNLFAPSLAGRMVAGPELATLGQSTRPYAATGGRTLAHPEIAGPTPASMHIAGALVTRPPTDNAGLARASQYAHPSTATALGARAPAGWGTSAHAAVGGRALGAASSERAFGTSMGTSAYGSGYRGAVRGETRTLGQESFRGGGAFEHRSFGGPPGMHGAYSYGSHAFSHPGMVHGAPAPQYHPPYYGGGYHPQGGGFGGGHFGGHGGGGRGGGGGHR